MSGGHTVSAAVAQLCLTLPTADDMRGLGTRLASLVRRGDLLVLTGDLGAGKTTLVQGLGAGMRVRGPISSPTFVIARVHRPVDPDDAALVHVDAYRLGSAAELDDLDLDAALEDSVTVVEWGAGLVEDLSPDRLELALGRPHGGAAGAGAEAGGGAGAEADLLDGDVLDGDQPRTVLITGYGARWAALPAALAPTTDD